MGGYKIYFTSSPTHRGGRKSKPKIMTSNEIGRNFKGARSNADMLAAASTFEEAGRKLQTISRQMRAKLQTYTPADLLTANHTKAKEMLEFAAAISQAKEGLDEVFLLMVGDPK